MASIDLLLIVKSIWINLTTANMSEVRAIDVSAYLQQRGFYGAWLVQKLAYYCQAWSMVWDGAPLFSEEFEAWRDGPVCQEIRNGCSLGDPHRLSPQQRATVEAVLKFYGRKPTDWLVELTHREPPWCGARHGLPPDARGNCQIQKQAIRSYYQSLGVQPKMFSEDFMTALEFLVDTPKNDQIIDGSDFVEWLNAGVLRNWEAYTN